MPLWRHLHHFCRPFCLHLSHPVGHVGAVGHQPVGHILTDGQPGDRHEGIFITYVGNFAFMLVTLLVTLLVNLTDMKAFSSLILPSCRPPFRSPCTCTLRRVHLHLHVQGVQGDWQVLGQHEGKMTNKSDENAFMKAFTSIQFCLHVGQNIFCLYGHCLATVPPHLPREWICQTKH